MLVDVTWIYSADEEFARFFATKEEQTETWKIAKSMGRFDSSMDLVPLLSGYMVVKDNCVCGSLDGVMNSASSMFQSWEAVLESQADHVLKKGDWDASAELYEKSNQPIEIVVSRILVACWIRPSSVLTASGREETEAQRDYVIGSIRNSETFD